MTNNKKKLKDYSTKMKKVLFIKIFFMKFLYLFANIILLNNYFWLFTSFSTK